MYKKVRREKGRKEMRKASREEEVAERLEIVFGESPRLHLNLSSSFGLDGCVSVLFLSPVFGQERGL